MSKNFDQSAIIMLFIVLELFVFSARLDAQFPEFPPVDVTKSMDRDQMMYQLGIAFPELPPKMEDPHKPLNAWPANPANPDGNWRKPDDWGSLVAWSWGVTDTWTDPYGMYLTCVGATPVYELLGKQGLIMADPKPKVDVAYISGDIGYRYHKEGHVDRPDWPAFFEFAANTILQKEILYTIEEMQLDFNQMRQTLEKEHCCLYEYTSKEDFDNLFQHQYELITGPLHPHEFFNILSRVTAKIGCMHTAIWMPGSYWEMNSENLFPLQVKLIENYMVVTGTYNETEQVPVGSIIHEINKKPAHLILEEMRQSISADAFNIYFINTQIEKRFPIHYASRYGFPERYRITYSLPEQNVRLTMDLIPANNQAMRTVVYKNFNHPKLIFKLFENKNTAVMIIPTFIYYDDVPYFKNFLDSSFTMIREKNIQNLILDLRGNDGGDPFCAVPLLSYLEHEPVPYYAEPYGRYADFAQPIPMAENHFTGNLYTLLDGYCGSTNGHFCALLKYNKIGKFIGTPSGATYKCNAGRDTEISLEHTRLILTFGRTTFAAAVSGMDKTKPILPDYPVQPTYDDFIDGRDVFMEKAWQLINENRNNEEAPVTFCNPLDLNYRYQPNAPSRREAADPTMVLFKDRYFLFVSKTGGYWWSDDLKEWNLIETSDIPVEDYAPTVVVIGDTIYFMASSTEVRPIFKSDDPMSGKWQTARDTFPFPVWDPALFLDGDRLYLYWGCSNVNPIWGIELDYRNKFEPMGKPVVCLAGDTEQHGWERPGDKNELSQSPWIEGAWMNKLNGKYYLQYAGPGTEFKSYADGVYVSDHPLGPFKYASHNPFSLKAGGVSCGAGHGSTFSDKFGNLWHIGTMSISVNHQFERRLGLFPVKLDEDSVLYTCTSFGDYPYFIPNYKFSDPDDLFTEWMLLSYKKPVTASSFLKEFPPENAVDEDIRSSWSAATGSQGEWISIDLHETSEIKAVQVNYADYQSGNYSRDSSCYYQYLMEWSSDGVKWEILNDGRKSRDDSPHLYVQLQEPVFARFIKLTNVHIPGGHFALSGFRIFGKGPVEKPAGVSNLYIKRNSDDPAIATLSWSRVPLATGYTIRYGTDIEKLYSSHMVYTDTMLMLRSLNADQRYFFTIDAFNEGGITHSGILQASE